MNGIAYPVVREGDDEIAQLRAPDPCANPYLLQTLKTAGELARRGVFDVRNRDCLGISGA